jgi:hypothetical protein
MFCIAKKKTNKIVGNQAAVPYKAVASIADKKGGLPR